MRILLLGHTGYVGHRLLGYLKERFDVKTSSSTSGDFIVDLLDFERYSNVFKDQHFDVVISSVVKYPTNTNDLIHNAQTACNILTYFQDKAKQIIFISSVFADEKNKFYNLYNYSKYLEGETINYFSNIKNNICTLRFCQIIDHSGKSRRTQRGFHYLIDGINSNSDINVFCLNDTPRSYISVELVCEAIMNAIDYKYTGIHNIVLQPMLTLNELVDRLKNKKSVYSGKINLLDKEAISYHIPQSSRVFEDFILKNNMNEYLLDFIYD